MNIHKVGERVAIVSREADRIIPGVYGTVDIVDRVLNPGDTWLEGDQEYENTSGRDGYLLVNVHVPTRFFFEESLRKLDDKPSDQSFDELMDVLMDRATA